MVEVVKLDIDAGAQSLADGISRILCDEVLVEQLANRSQVAEDDPFKTPFFAEEISQQPGIRRARDSIDLMVGAHRTERPALDEGRAESLEHYLTHFAFADLHGALIESALRTSVAREVLRLGNDIERSEIALHSAHVSLAHRAGEPGILAEGFLGPTPTRVACQAKHR